MKQRTLKLTIISALLASVACAPNDLPSPIVDKAKAAGAGDISQLTSLQSLETWLAQNRTPAIQIESMCKQARVNASASWGDTSEGRLCRASEVVAPIWSDDKITGDGRSFSPGNLR